MNIIINNETSATSKYVEQYSPRQMSVQTDILHVRRNSGFCLDKDTGWSRGLTFFAVLSTVTFTILTAVCSFSQELRSSILFYYFDLTVIDASWSCLTPGEMLRHSPSKCVFRSFRSMLHPARLTADPQTRVLNWKRLRTFFRTVRFIRTVSSVIWIESEATIHLAAVLRPWEITSFSSCFYAKDLCLYNQVSWQ